MATCTVSLGRVPTWVTTDALEAAVMRRVGSTCTRKDLGLLHILQSSEAVMRNCSAALAAQLVSTSVSVHSRMHGWHVCKVDVQYDPAQVATDVKMPGVVAPPARIVAQPSTPVAAPDGVPGRAVPEPNDTKRRGRGAPAYSPLTATPQQFHRGASFGRRDTRGDNAWDAPRPGRYDLSHDTPGHRHRIDEDSDGGRPTDPLLVPTRSSKRVRRADALSPHLWMGAHSVVAQSQHGYNPFAAIPGPRGRDDVESRWGSGAGAGASDASGAAAGSSTAGAGDEYDPANAYIPPPPPKAPSLYSTTTGVTVALHAASGPAVDGVVRPQLATPLIALFADTTCVGREALAHTVAWFTQQGLSVAAVAHPTVVTGPGGRPEQQAHVNLRDWTIARYVSGSHKHDVSVLVELHPPAAAAVWLVDAAATMCVQRVPAWVVPSVVLEPVLKTLVTICAVAAVAADTRLDKRGLCEQLCAAVDVLASASSAADESEPAASLRNPTASCQGGDTGAFATPAVDTTSGTACWGSGAGTSSTRRPAEVAMDVAPVAHE